VMESTEMANMVRNVGLRRGGSLHQEAMVCSWKVEGNLGDTEETILPRRGSL
jgi:hypothetical protein